MLYSGYIGSIKLNFCKNFGHIYNFGHKFWRGIYETDYSKETKFSY